VVASYLDADRAEELERDIVAVDTSSDFVVFVVAVHLDRHLDYRFVVVVVVDKLAVVVVVAAAEVDQESEAEQDIVAALLEAVAVGMETCMVALVDHNSFERIEDEEADMNFD
jgi:putative ribosome biogenesis GTPase RsgA